MIVTQLHVHVLMHDFHIIATLMACRELFIERFIGLLQKAERNVGKHHAPSIGGAGRVLFVYGNVVVCIALFHQQRKVHAGGPTTHNRNFHKNPLNLNAHITLNTLRIGHQHLCVALPGDPAFLNHVVPVGQFR